MQQHAAPPPPPGRQGQAVSLPEPASASAERSQQRVILLRRTDGDTQELLDTWLLEVPHDHALLAQARGYRGRIALRMTCENEVRRRWQNLEPQPLHRSHPRLATVDDLLTGLLEMGAILERRHGATDGELGSTSCWPNVYADVWIKLRP